MRLPFPDCCRRPLFAAGQWAALSPWALSPFLVACATVAPTGPVAAVSAAPVTAAAASAASAAPGAGLPTPPLGAATKAAKPPAPASAPGANALPAAGAPAAFAAVIKDARKVEGLLTLWQKDEKVWIELRPQDLDRPFFLSPKIATGIGEAGLFGGSMIGSWQPWGRAQIVEFRRVHNQVQLVARNDQFIAAAGSPQARAVKAAFSDSLLGSAAVASLPQAESKAVLVEANSLFVSDLLGLGITLQRQYRQNYAFDARNSAITEVRGAPDETVLKVQAHYYSGSLSFPQPGSPPGTGVPLLPGALPDARSLFLGLHYSFARLPAQVMAPRLADPRVGHFTTVVQDFGNDLQRSPRQHFVNRWRLEKQDPAAAISPPVKPITFWLDRSIPLRYRDTISRGVLEWNKAFEKIGFRDALAVKVQPEDADFDTLDVGTASIRWMTNAQPLFGAIGPSQVDPRSGEILDADIGIESLSLRGQRTVRSQIIAPRSQVNWAALMQVPAADDPEAPMRRAEGPACQYADQAAEQLGYALDLLASRSEIEPDSPEAEAFVQAYLFNVTVHEVGHTLGLRHNFRASRVYTDAQLSDLAFTEAHGLSGSVMEYTPVNLSRSGEPGGTPFQTTLGPYDEWAVAYAYTPTPAGATPQQEAELLQAIASRSAERELAYGTDEDNALGIDPEVLMFDLGDDPVVFAKKRLDIARELIGRQNTRTLKATEDYSVLRRAIGFALRDAGRAAGVLARQIGGLRTLRDFPGTGRDPLQPVPVAVQRDALNALVRGVLDGDGLRISPALARKLGPDFLERSEEGSPTDYSVEAMLLDLQRSLLALLMSDSLAARLLDAEAKADRRSDVMPLADVYRQLTTAVWGDAWRGGDIPAARRELQREHMNRLASLLLRPSPASRADARSLLRSEARRLLGRLQGATRSASLSAEARAHLSDSVATLRGALAAPLQRSGI